MRTVNDFVCGCVGKMQPKVTLIFFMGGEGTNKMKAYQT